MTLSGALTNAYTGLSASSLRANIASNNIANANTPGYVRREVVLGENRVAGSGNGVSTVGISRAQDFALTSERRQAEASAGRADVVSRALTELNAALGEPDDGFGLFATYQETEQALRALAATPESPALQTGLFSATTRLAAEFRDLSELVQRQRTDADNAIASAVISLNSTLRQIEQLNGDIASVNEEAGEAVALEDQRQNLIDQVSQLIPVRQIRQPGGGIDLITNEGVFLLAGTAREVSFSPSGVVSASSTYDNGAGSLSGLSVNGQDITPGGPGNLAVQTGVLSGFFAVRDEIAPQFNTQLDALAADLIARFSDDTLDPTKTAGAPGIFTDDGNALNPTLTTGIASRISINAAIDPGQGGLVSRLRDGLGAATPGPSGEATIINNFLDALTDQRAAGAGTGLTGNFSSIEAVASISSIVGEARVRADAVLISASAKADVLNEAEITQSGVDTDRELQSLLLIEQAYAANARVIQTVSDMINRLLEL